MMALNISKQSINISRSSEFLVELVLSFGIFFLTTEFTGLDYYVYIYIHR